MNPYKRKEVLGDCTLYLGDCLEILPTLEKVDSVITDPVWPNCQDGMLCGANGSQGKLLHDALVRCDCQTVVVVLGFDSDPRFLRFVPDRWKFIRSQNLPYAVPGYRGRLLGGDEVAYVFGEIPKGRGVIPGRARAVTSKKSDRATGHPCPRADEHVEQLCGWWSPFDGKILDPFMGSGATGVASTLTGRKFIGIEIEEKYFNIAVERIKAAQAQLRLFA